MDTTSTATDSAKAILNWGVDGQQPDMSLADCVTIDDVRAAAKRIEGHVTRTPVVTSDELDRVVGAKVYLKCENLQRMGAFKLRGAFSAMLGLDASERSKGVLTFSSGNHAQAVALAAAELGVRAVIVMPDNAPRVKLERTQGHLDRAPKGSRIELYDPVEAKREEIGREIVGREGLTLIPPYDHADVIAGQGTAAMELIDEVGELDALYVCVGGGGLLSGSAVSAHAMCRACRVVGVEPELADDASRSFRDGVLRTVRAPKTIADGARTPYLGRHTLPLILRHVDDMMTVSERDIAGAMAFAMSWARLVIEPSGGLGLAGLLRAKRDGATIGDRVGIVLSGGNVDLARLEELLRLAE